MSKEKFFYSVNGFCPICETKSKFKSNHKWLRDHYVCSKCESIPRERALMYVLKKLLIHESSPIDRGVSKKLKHECSNYIQFHFFPNKKNKKVGNFYDIDLQNQWLNDSSFDCVITQDVMEHIPNLKLAIQEIYRTLKNCGYDIVIAPLVDKFEKTVKWTEVNGDEIKWFFIPEYHGNPIDSKGSPVFWHYGYDISNLMQNWSSFCVIIFSLEIPKLGIEGEYNEVIVCKKGELH